MNSRRMVGDFGRLLPLISVALACARPTESPVTAPEPDPHFRPVAAEVRKFILDTMRVLGAPGAAICVRKDGKLVWTEGFGHADLEQQVPVTTQTRFRIGSVSKPLTAAALGLLGKAGMSHTGADFPDSIVPARSRFYTRPDSVGAVVNAPFVDNSYKWASGGFLSTAEDLAQFGEQMLDGRLLDSATVAFLWTSQRTTDGKATDYGIGWGVEQDAAGRRLISHSGGSIGGTANLLIYPTERLIVVVLVNSDRTFVKAMPRYAEPFLEE